MLIPLQFFTIFNILITIPWINILFAMIRNLKKLTMEEKNMQEKKVKDF